MDRIAVIQIFMRVAELKSFTQAADSLDLPKATVSTAVQQLEALLGTKLLYRTTRRVLLSPEGQLYYERAQDLLADLDEVESMFRGSQSQLKGKLRIDMSVALARNLVIPHLPNFFKLHPDIELELSSTDRRMDLLREGLDCVIRVGKSHETGLISQDLGQMKLVNCASPEYLHQHGYPRTVNDLKQHYLIHYAQDLGSKPEGFEYFDGQRYREEKMKSKLTVNNTIAYESACLAGLGIIQAPLVGVKAHLLAGHLVRILPDFEAESLPLTLIYPYRRRLVKRLKVLMEWLEPLLSEYLCSD